jgi:hypothetical protein
MAIIDLRHLVQPEYDTIEFVVDGKEYRLPVIKTVNSMLNMRHQFELLQDKVKSGEIPEDTLLNYDAVYVTGWMKSYYPEVSRKWAEEKIPFDLMQTLAGYIYKFFLTGESKQQEPGKPKRTRKRTKS